MKGDDIGIGDGEPVTVSELTETIRGTLAGLFSRIEVRGEISRLTVASSGHRYFTLKDEGAIISCVMWRSRTLDPAIVEGTEVIATGSISVYPPRGSYQLDCTSIREIGAGDLAKAFEALKKKLAAEGLFDPDRKRPLPQFPRRIGVVTSPTGAAIRDIIDTLARRMPTVEVVVSPARVQGSGAADEIIRALERFAEGDVDVIIVGRGGGSAEDLQEFNDERLARTIASLTTPVISAVGHEIDFSITDFVADVRAATPTAAAELAVMNRADLLASIEHRLRTVRGLVRRTLDRLDHRLSSLERSRGMGRPRDMVFQHIQTLDELDRRIGRGLRERFREASARLEQLDSSLRALDPDRVLARGYAIVEHQGEAIGTVEPLVVGEEVRIRLKDGTRTARIEPEENGDGKEEPQ